MKLIGLARLGRDAETRYTQGGDPITSFSAAFDYGKKDADNRRPSQWVKFTIWGERGEKLAPHLLKGAQLFLVASELHVETFEKSSGGTGVALVARVDDLQFSGSKAEGAAPAPRASAPAPAARQAAPKSGTGFDNMDDDIPF